MATHTVDVAKGSQRIEADAMFDDVHGVVEVAGQVLGRPVDVEAASIEIRTSWGDSCAARTGRLGSFGVRLGTSDDRRGQHVEVRCDGSAVTLTVR